MAADEFVTGLLIVDHGSRRAESNQLLQQAAQRFAKYSGWAIVEPAHMELAEPSIQWIVRHTIVQSIPKNLFQLIAKSSVELCFMTRLLKDHEKHHMNRNSDA